MMFSTQASLVICSQVLMCDDSLMVDLCIGGSSGGKESNRLFVSFPPLGLGGCLPLSLLFVMERGFLPLLVW